MTFKFSNRELTQLPPGAERCWLLSNGLGGYMSTSSVFSVTRRDQGILVAAESPSRRFSLVHRLSESVAYSGETHRLSSQLFSDGSEPETGSAALESFTFHIWPVWEYRLGDITLRRRMAMAYGENRSAVVYEVENGSTSPCRLTVTPMFQFCPKGDVLKDMRELDFDGGSVSSWGKRVYISTDGLLRETDPIRECLAYPDDDKDGREGCGYAQGCCEIVFEIPAGAAETHSIVFSTSKEGPGADEIFSAAKARRDMLVERSGFKSPVARELAAGADTFIAYRPSTGGKTIIAGYPYFADWGRDTMISMPGCVLSTGRYDEAASILRTFLACEREGLVPNLFPEGEEEPMYNTVDASLLLINGVWLYWSRTGAGDFVREAWPVMKRIVRAYIKGTRHAIHMDADGLISAGSGLDQVTWMDVCVEGILPTPRHGKPVEINAYWYSALSILRELAPLAGESGEEYGRLARRVRESFIEKFWMEDKGYLRDVISGTGADEQIRCNQIWALTMPFSMLSPEQERRVVDTVYRHLYTPYGLRTLSPEDPEFHPFYGGCQKERDMAYHQGTVWPFPLGAWYRAYLKVNGHSREAVRQVREWLEPMGDILREGCVGQIPEIYDGLRPRDSKGCFAQAWSVGEMLRVYEELERTEEGRYA